MTEWPKVFAKATKQRQTSQINFLLIFVWYLCMPAQTETLLVLFSGGSMSDIIQCLKWLLMKSRCVYLHLCYLFKCLIEIPFVCPCVCVCLTEKDIRQHAVDEMMQRIKKGVQLRRVSQRTNRARPGPVHISYKHKNTHYFKLSFIQLISVIKWNICWWNI